MSKKKEVKSLSILEADIVVLSGDCECWMVTSEGCTTYDLLKSDQEEPDNKVILHTFDALSCREENVVIRSPSWDTDIIVIALCVLEEKERVMFDNGKWRQ